MREEHVFCAHTLSWWVYFLLLRDGIHEFRHANLAAITSLHDAVDTESCIRGLNGISWAIILRE